MLKKLLLLSVCIILPHAAFAGSIVTWEAFGAIDRATTYFPLGPGPFPPDGPPLPPQSPPVGTAYSIELMFDPDARLQTAGAPAGSPCYMTPVTGSFELGGVGYGMRGTAFTNSFLPGSNCGLSPYPPGAIEFFMGVFPLTTDDWDLNAGPRFLNLTYFDRLHTDGTFPSVPSMAGSFSELLFQNEFFQFTGDFVPQAVPIDPATPVPEPGTMMLVGVGLAIAARRKWRANGA